MTSFPRPATMKSRFGVPTIVSDPAVPVMRRSEFPKLQFAAVASDVPPRNAAREVATIRNSLRMSLSLPSTVSPLTFHVKKPAGGLLLDRPSSRAMTAGRSFLGERRPLSSDVGTLLSGMLCRLSRLPLGRLRGHGLQSDVVDHAPRSAPEE